MATFIADFDTSTVDDATTADVGTTAGSKNNDRWRTYFEHFDVFSVPPMEMTAIRVLDAEQMIQTVGLASFWTNAEGVTLLYEKSGEDSKSFWNDDYYFSERRIPLVTCSEEQFKTLLGGKDVQEQDGYPSCFTTSFEANEFQEWRRQLAKIQRRVTRGARVFKDHRKRLK